MEKFSLSLPEKVSFTLRSIYEKYGYTRYKMSKFEEYGLYARFGDALLSGGVITFTDIGGKLMALKPDVTLSIIKNGRNSAGVQKVYYDEKVYRVPKGGDAFKEIPQVGLECMGEIDDYSVAEVLRLAGESLKAITDKGVLDVCHLGILSDILENNSVSKADAAEIARLMGEKNLHELKSCCLSAGMDEQSAALVTELASTYGKPALVLPRLAEKLGPKYSAGIAKLELLLDTLPMEIANLVNIDFSAGTDFGYYNGLVLKGYVAGVPTAVLSGGQYDKLMGKMGRNGGAVGFAVYPDVLQSDATEEENPLSLLLYSKDEEISNVAAASELLRGIGLKVYAATERSARQSYKYVYILQNGEVRKLEDNA